MREEELIDKLEKAEFPQIEMESHRSRLRMALLNSDYFKKKKESRFMESVKAGPELARHAVADGILARHPVWKIAVGSVVLMVLLFYSLLLIPPTSGVMKSTFFPEGKKVISGPQLTADQKEKAIEILMADSRIQDLLATGAVIDSVLPIDVVMQRNNSETGQPETVSETWAQAWIVKGSTTWGVQVDLVRGVIAAISP